MLRHKNKEKFYLALVSGDRISSGKCIKTF